LRDIRLRRAGSHEQPGQHRESPPPTHMTIVAPPPSIQPLPSTAAI
jgi:hypothetical protein